MLSEKFVYELYVSQEIMKSPLSVSWKYMYMFEQILTAIPVKTVPIVMKNEFCIT